MTKLGPCPLCGDSAESSWEGDERVRCSNIRCSMPDSDEIGMWSKTWNRLSALAASERRMRAALERRDAAILWMFVNGPDGVDGVEKDCYAFAEDAAGEKDRPTDADGIEGYLRMLESHEDFQSCLEAVRRNVNYEALKGDEG